MDVQDAQDKNRFGNRVGREMVATVVSYIFQLRRKEPIGRRHSLWRRSQSMSISTRKMPTNRLENRTIFQDDIVAQENSDFINPRTWEVTETKGSERSFSGHGTWEHAENKADVGNVCFCNFHGDKLPLCRLDEPHYFAGPHDNLAGIEFGACFMRVAGLVFSPQGPP